MSGLITAAFNQLQQWSGHQIIAFFVALTLIFFIPAYGIHMEERKEKLHYENFKADLIHHCKKSGGDRVEVRMSVGWLIRFGTDIYDCIAIGPKNKIIETYVTEKSGNKYNFVVRTR